MKRSINVVLETTLKPFYTVILLLEVKKKKKKIAKINTIYNLAHGIHRCRSLLAATLRTRDIVLGLYTCYPGSLMLF